MSDQWEFFYCAIEGAPASVFVDVGICDSVPDESRPHRVIVTTFLQDPTDQGMTTDAEAEQLWKLEESLVRELRDAAGAVFVGRITTGGARSFYFYVANPVPVSDKTDDAFDQVPGYDHLVDIDADTEWSDYFETLYPAPVDWQQIFDRQLVEQLIEAGDPLTPAREVAHYLYFNSTEGRETFVEVVTALGFVVSDRSEQSEEDHPHALRITRDDPVVMDHIHNVTRDLLSHAAPEGGIYDGWECEVVGPEVS
jgi:regulator of RNase E activity RraB